MDFFSLKFKCEFKKTLAPLCAVATLLLCCCRSRPRSLVFVVSLLRCFFVTFFLVVSHHSTATYLLITQASLMLHFLCDLQVDSLGFFHVILCFIVNRFLLKIAHNSDNFGYTSTFHWTL